MTYFETVGVDYQYNARSMKEAKKAFERSCDKCCTKGIHIECPRLCNCRRS